PHSQPPVALRAQVDRHLQQGQVVEAVALMSAHSRDDFPRQWDPRPRPGYGEDWPPLETVLHAIQKDSAAPWVRDLYFAKLAQLMDQGHHWSARFWTSLSDEEFPQYMQLLRDAPEMQELVRQNPEPLQRALSYLGPAPSRDTD